MLFSSSVSLLSTGCPDCPSHFLFSPQTIAHALHPWSSASPKVSVALRSCPAHWAGNHLKMCPLLSRVLGPGHRAGCIRVCCRNEGFSKGSTDPHQGKSAHQPRWPWTAQRVHMPDKPISVCPLQTLAASQRHRRGSWGSCVRPGLWFSVTGSFPVLAFIKVSSVRH